MSFVMHTPSLASTTGTNLDSSSKHIQQCRISYDHMMEFVENGQVLEREKMSYCVHKDEIVVGISRPWYKEDTRALPPSAYPRVISCLGDITQPKYDACRKMMLYMYHFATSIRRRNEILEQFRQHLQHGVPTNTPDARNYFNDPQNAQPMNLQPFIHKMYDYYPVGVANTLGYAHPNSGDTMTSVMIGGLRTVQNGDFPIFAGDIVQWYWTFEANCFHAEDGRRKSIMNANGTVADGGDPEVDYGQGIGNQGDPIHPHHPLRVWNDWQFGRKNGSRIPADKSKHVARIKAYVRDDDQPRLYDWARVFGIAISSAGPNERVDIKISTQST